MAAIHTEGCIRIVIPEDSTDSTYDFEVPQVAAPTPEEIQKQKAREKTKLAFGKARKKAPRWMKPPRK